jgi:hypothetical protein
MMMQACGEFSATGVRAEKDEKVNTNGIMFESG